jgi:hypothetical protein
VRVRGAVATLVGVLGVGLVLAGCGDDDAELTRAEFQNRANAICSRHIKAIEDAAKGRFAAKEIPLATEIESLAEGTVVPEIERMREELADLDAPDADERDFESYLSELKRALDDEVKQDPATILSEEASQNAFVESDDLAGDAGLTECARLGKRLQESVGAPRLNR